jgi:hypothetical protein
MRKIQSAPLFISIAILFSSCATMFGKSSYPVTVNSVPREVVVKVYNRKGIEIFSDTTPYQIKLKSNAGYFRRAIYTFEFDKEGYERSTEVITAKVNPWYYANLLFGGYIGLLILDPLTGAMYKIQTREVTLVLSPKRQAGK